MTDELKPCPFCGGEAELITGPVKDRFGTMCNSCDAWHDTRAATKSDAIAAWNARAPTVPEGFALVPVELNHALEDVFWEAWEDEKESLIATEGSYSLAQLFKAAWSAMLAALAPAPAPDDVALVDELRLSAYAYGNGGDAKDREDMEAARDTLLARLRQRDDRDTVLEECAMLANTMRGVDDATAAKIAAAIRALKGK